jgi:hypothetical protein
VVDGSDSTESARLLDRTLHLRHSKQARTAEAATQALELWLEQTIVSPRASDPVRLGAPGRTAPHLCRM